MAPLFFLGFHPSHPNFHPGAENSNNSQQAMRAGRKQLAKRSLHIVMKFGFNQ